MARDARNVNIQGRNLLRSLRLSITSELLLPELAMAPIAHVVLDLSGGIGKLHCINTYLLDDFTAQPKIQQVTYNDTGERLFLLHSSFKTATQNPSTSTSQTDDPMH